MPEANGCALDGPGVGRSTIKDILILIWLQLLLWAALLLLPYSGTYEPRTASIDFSRARLLWARAKQEGTLGAGTQPIEADR